MPICIICRNEKTEFNDEHVIPDSIEGYYHIRKVCVECNSIIGHKIDYKLTNHKFIEFQRFLFGIKGKSGQVPNPFSGTLKMRDDPNQKVHLMVDADGKFRPKLLTNVKEIKVQGVINSFSVTIDAKDAAIKDKIIEKVLMRNGISREQVKISEVHRSNKPWIEAKLTIDIGDFKLGLLKIAYEFTVDQIPEYFSDPNAKLISKLLLEADFETFEKKIAFIGNGFDKTILESFSHLIDFENRNHYLILVADPEMGLVCLINLYKVFSIGILMSERGNYLVDSPIIIGKNDTSQKEFRIYKMNDLVRNVYSPIEYRFNYFIPKDAIKEFHLNENSKEFGFYTLNNRIPFFNSQGEIKYSSIEEKLEEDSLEKVELGDTVNSMITDVILNEELYIRLLPNNILYRVISVGLEQHKVRKL